MHFLFKFFNYWCSLVKFLKIGGDDLGFFEILAFSIAAGSLSLALFAMGKVENLEKKMKELEDKINEN